MRGHYPLETQLLKADYEKNTGKTIDGEVMCPFSKRAEDLPLIMYYVKYGEELVPANETEFAKDKTLVIQRIPCRNILRRRQKGI